MLASGQRRLLELAASSRDISPMKLYALMLGAAETVVRRGIKRGIPRIYEDRIVWRDI